MWIFYKVQVFTVGAQLNVHINRFVWIQNRYSIQELNKNQVYINSTRNIPEAQSTLIELL